MQQNFGGDVVSFPLPQIINMEGIESLASDLKQFASLKNQTFILDASHVESINTAGLQLIVSLQKTLLSLGRVLLVSGGSVPFAAAASDAGLEGSLSGGDR